MASLRFYLDENVPIQIANQLKSRDTDAITVRDLNLLGEDDVNHLQIATQQGRVLCTYDSDFLDMAASGIQHAGIVFGQQVSDESSWKPIPEPPNVYTLAISIGNFAVPAGSFENCFQVTTVFLSGPRLQWFCNGIGIVREKHDHRGTPFGYEQVLIGFWEGEG